ncbi:MAG: hypothetical protein P1U34_04475 [Coxiellaceae bacterium]|nr:hypothetical protein [Coxiellaceae bacterium]
MRTSDDGCIAVRGCTDVAALAFCVVNIVGGLALYKAFTSDDSLSHGDIASIAVMAVSDIALLGFAAYKLYQCTRPSDAPQLLALEQRLMPGGTGAAKRDGDGGDGAIDVESPLRPGHLYAIK